MRIIPEKASNKSFLPSNFGQKSSQGHMSISPRGGARGLERWYCSNIKLYRNGKLHSLLNWMMQKCAKVFRHRILDKSEGVYPSPPPWVEPRELERWYGLNIELYRNGKLHSLLGWTLLKIRIILKKLQIKVFRHQILDKKVCEGICLSPPPGVELGGSKDDLV